MTDATSRYVPPDEKRSIIENAILAFRPNVASDYRWSTPPKVPKAQQALADLGAATNIPRLVKHRRLIDGLRQGRPAGRARHDEAQLLASTLGPDLPGDRRSLADQAGPQLTEAAAAPGERRLQPQHWQQWVQGTDDFFRFTTHERTFEACNDQQEVPKPTPDGQVVDSRLIIAEFWSDLPPAAFRTYVDARNWPRCSPFWRSMDPLGPVVRTADGYDGDFAETVNIISETLTVPLQIGFRVLPDQSRVWTRFNISRKFYDQFPDTQVDVDTGTVSAELVPGGPAPTRVRATKYLHWRESSRPDLTDLACDFGWADLMEEMADGCAGGFPAADAAGTPVDAAIGELVGAVTAEWQQGMSDSRPHLERLMGRFTGSSWDAGWINDLLGMGLVTARRYGNMASGVRRFADSLRDADD